MSEKLNELKDKWNSLIRKETIITAAKIFIMDRGEISGNLIITFALFAIGEPGSDQRKAFEEFNKLDDAEFKLEQKENVTH